MGKDLNFTYRHVSIGDNVFETKIKSFVFDDFKCVSF